MEERRVFGHGPNRRQASRGGRRAGDKDGFAPLVLIVGDEDTAVANAEAILAKLKFAVSMATSVDEALRVIPDLRPDLVVVRERDETRVREATSVPVLVMRSGGGDAVDGLIEDVLRTVRSPANAL